MTDHDNKKPWVSFCISTYKRQELLKTTLETIAKQSFTAFEVVISDNDPGKSAETVVQSMYDSRFKYFWNGENLGMIKSFNKSIERAIGKFIVMITDDDPVHDTFLAEISKLVIDNHGYGLYAGFLRSNKPVGDIERIAPSDFAIEILSPQKTTNILWSSCIIDREIALQIGKIPDYGSPHLADHALIAMAGSIKGGVVINKMFSTLTSHNDNFSKKHLETYILGCTGFYQALTGIFATYDNFESIKRSIESHLGNWFIVNYFALKKYYSSVKVNKAMLEETEAFASEILALDFMKKFMGRYKLKNLIFSIKAFIK